MKFVKLKQLYSAISACVQSFDNVAEFIKSMYMNYTVVSRLHQINTICKTVDECINYIKSKLVEKMNSDEPYTDFLINLEKELHDKFLGKLTNVDIVLILMNFDSCVCAHVPSNVHIRLIREGIKANHWCAVNRASVLLSKLHVGLSLMLMNQGLTDTARFMSFLFIAELFRCVKASMVSFIKYSNDPIVETLYNVATGFGDLVEHLLYNVIKSTRCEKFDIRDSTGNIYV